MLKIEDTLGIIIVEPSLKEGFCFFLGEQNWIEKDWDGYVREFESKGLILIESTNPIVPRMLSKSYDIKSPIIYYLIGCRDLIKELDIFGHYIYLSKTEWQTFLLTYKQLKNATLSDTGIVTGVP